MAAIQRSISGLDVPIYCSADASASPMLSPTREADDLTVSRARCAYRAVVRTWVWPSSFPIIGRLSPSPTAREAKAVTQLTDVGRRPHVRRVGRAGLFGALTAEKEGVSGYRRTRPRDRHARGRRPCPRAQSALDEAACSHRAIRTGSGRKAARVASFKWVNTALSNIKCAVTGTYRKLGPDHTGRYLASFAWRYNRRYQLQTMIPRFVHSAARTDPMPYRLLIAG